MEWKISPKLSWSSQTRFMRVHTVHLRKLFRIRIEMLAVQCANGFPEIFLFGLSARRHFLDTLVLLSQPSAFASGSHRSRTCVQIVLRAHTYVIRMKKKKINSDVSRASTPNMYPSLSFFLRAVLKRRCRQKHSIQFKTDRLVIWCVCIDIRRLRPTLCTTEYLYLQQLVLYIFSKKKKKINK